MTDDVRLTEAEWRAILMAAADWVEGAINGLDFRDTVESILRERLAQSATLPLQPSDAAVRVAPAKEER